MLTKGSEIMRADDQSALRLDTRSLSKAEVVLDFQPAVLQECIVSCNVQCVI